MRGEYKLLHVERGETTKIARKIVTGTLDAGWSSPKPTKICYPTCAPSGCQCTKQQGLGAETVLPISGLSNVRILDYAYFVPRAETPFRW